MRFSRSLKSKRSPPEIRRAGRAAHRDSSKLQLLLEQWTQCDGVWAESDFVIECRRKTRHRQYGARVWLTRSELITKYQSVAVADSIIEAKEQDEETRQYLVWEKDGEEEQTDHAKKGKHKTSSKKKAQGKKGSKKTKKTKKAKDKSSDSSSSDDEKSDTKKPETDEQKKKREEKEAEAEKKRQQKEAEAALTRMGNSIAKAMSLEDKLHTMSKSVSEAILVEVKPHLEKLRKVRGGLQKAVDEAKALRPYYTS
ncbi:unnamed protein product [Durusdinium trenchii]|uniref:Uncharacterized protein n=2 Tax=Durusdinium trenchii TaxID=1381693 RepID=A0ABP0HHX9_9DINO